MARGLTRSVSKRVRLPLPSRLALSITSGLESTQNINLRFTSTARPSGLTRSTQSSETRQKTSSSHFTTYKSGSHQVFLLVLMSISGSAPGATEALLMVLAERSVQQTLFSLQSKTMPTTMEPWTHKIRHVTVIIGHSSTCVNPSFYRNLRLLLLAVTNKSHQPTHMHSPLYTV